MASRASEVAVAPAPSGAAALPPAGLRLCPAAGVRLAPGGQVLLGGSPLRLLRLSARGASLVARWWAGSPLGADHGERLLARRLLDAGFLDPCVRLADPHQQAADPDRRSSELTVVIPVHGEAERLAACLRSLGGRCPTIVVDDGSPAEAAIAAVAAQFGADYVRHPTNRGAAAARNTGLRLCRTQFIAFLDCDCTATPDFPRALLGHFEDPLVALVAPRVVSAVAEGPIAAYERRRSPLDLGPRPARVDPRGRVPFLPSAALVCRRRALGSGFDERLRVGEDVDLAWRLHDAGWQSRLEPRVTVTHADRTRPFAWYRRRVQYNCAVVPLLDRHPGRLPVLHLSAPAAVAWTLALARGPLPLLALIAARAVRLHRLLARGLARPYGLAIRLAAGAGAREGAELARALLGPWAPLTASALAFCRLLELQAPCRRLAALVGGWLALDYLRDRLGPLGSQRHPAARHCPPARLPPLTYAVLRAADESARGLGIWLACLRARDFRALAPAHPSSRRSRRSPADAQPRLPSPSASSA